MLTATIIVLTLPFVLSGIIWSVMNGEWGYLVAYAAAIVLSLFASLAMFEADEKLHLSSREKK